MVVGAKWMDLMSGLIVGRLMLEIVGCLLLDGLKICADGACGQFNFGRRGFVIDDLNEMNLNWCRCENLHLWFPTDWDLLSIGLDTKRVDADFIFLYFCLWKLMDLDEFEFASSEIDILFLRVIKNLPTFFGPEAGRYLFCNFYSE